MTTNSLAVSQTKTFSLKGDINDILNTGDVTTGFVFAFDTGNAITDQTAGTANGIRALSNSNGQLVTLVSGANAFISQTTKIVRGTITVAKTNITPSNTEFARFDVTAHGNRVQITGANISLTNVTGAGQTGNAINIYKDGLGGTLIYSGAAGAVVFNQSPYYVEISNGQTVTFSVKVLNPIATLNGNTANPMGLDLSNVLYLDKLENGDVIVNDASSYKNTGAFPFTWSQ